MDASSVQKFDEAYWTASEKAIGNDGEKFKKFQRKWTREDGAIVFPFKASILDQTGAPSRMAFAHSLSVALRYLPSHRSSYRNLHTGFISFIENLDPVALTVDYVIRRPEHINKPKFETLETKKSRWYEASSAGYDMRRHIESRDTSTEQEFLWAYVRRRNHYRYATEEREVKYCKEIFEEIVAGNYDFISDWGELAIYQAAAAFNPQVKHETRKRLPDIRSEWK